MTIPIPPYVPGPPFVNRVQPFTLSDAETYLSKLERMGAFLRDLIPLVNDLIANRDEEFTTTVNRLIDKVNSADAELRAYFTSGIAAQNTAIGVRLDAFEADIDDELAAHLTETEAAVNGILSDLQSDFADLLAELQAYQNDQSAANDPITANLITGPSQTREALDPVIEGKVAELETAILSYVNQELEEKSDIGHTHPASATTTGVFDVARLPNATTGARGAARAATQAEVTAEALTVEFVSPATLAAWDKNLRPRLFRMVVAGSSNAVAGADYWPAKLATQLKLTPHIYSIAGSAYTNTNNFDAQIANAAAAMTTAQRLETGYVFIADASNNSRAKTAYQDVYNAAVQTYQRARDWFPNAKIVVIPQIWPADTAKYAPTAFPYEQVWPAWAQLHADAQRLALEWHSNAMFMDESWTWLHSRDAYMTANNDVHPNASGHTILARMIARALAGEDVTPRTGWTPVTPSSNPTAALGGRGRDMSVRRDGWDIVLDGSVRWTASGGGAVSADIATVPYGFRPTYNVQAMGTQFGIVTSGPNIQIPVEIWPNGAVRLYRAVPQNDGLWLSINYRVG